MKNTFLLSLIIFGAILMSSCDDDDSTVLPTDQNYDAILNNLGNSVILATYEDLATKGSVLFTATQALETNPSQTTLSTAREAWIAARSPWEQSEGFLFGPVDQEGLDPSMDSWPVNVIDLNNVMTSSSDLTVEFLQLQEGTLKGFHTIEFLLWGENGNKQVADFTPREFEYLAAASGALDNDTRALFDLWRPGSGNYINNILSAGSGSIVYISQKAALEEIVNSLIVIADEVGNGKINDPFIEKNLDLEESRFSANSKQDFADNMRSIQNIYTGAFNGHGNNNGISNVILENNSTIDSRVLSEINSAISSIENITGTFSEAVFNNPSDVADAQQAVRTLQETLESEVLPIVRSL